ncbi:MAG: 2-oxo acid dehydrogenase subunit E2 [Deltaproteobacteria bacterium]|nr:2-oxo acid dehydrogenase subunit E2 [Deltaproteobacteria bacterium]
MAKKIYMPQLSDTMFDGTIVAWKKKEGEPVKRGDILAEVATDKANLEIESFDEGVLLRICAEVNIKVSVGSVIAIIGDQGEDISQESAEESKTTGKSVTKPETPLSTVNNSAKKIDASDLEQERLKISPLARKLAEGKGVDFSQVQGSGENNRIVKRDIEAKLGVNETVLISSKGEAASSMRQTIARRMLESKLTIPHFYMTTKIDVANTLAVIKSLKEMPGYTRLTFNHLILFIVARCLREFPKLNAFYADDKITQQEQINLGVVASLPDGLLIPVLKNVDKLTLENVVEQASALIERARSNKLKGDDLIGATFNISNVGKFDIESFAAIISPGQSAILAVSSISEEAVVGNGNIKATSVIRTTLSADHRLLDGLDAAKFLSRLKFLIENPLVLWI